MISFLNCHHANLRGEHGVKAIFAQNPLEHVRRGSKSPDVVKMNPVRPRSQPRFFLVSSHWSGSS